MTNYKKQADKFCEDTGTIITVTLSKEQTPPDWDGDERHLKYDVNIKNKRGGFSFNFWGSINDYEEVQKYRHEPFRQFQVQKKVQPDNYTILACLHFFDGSFDDFCDCFGYSNDSMKAQKTYFEVRRQSGHLLDMYTSKELTILQDIN